MISRDMPWNSMSRRTSWPLMTLMTLHDLDSFTDLLHCRFDGLLIRRRCSVPGGR